MMIGRMMWQVYSAKPCNHVQQHLRRGGDDAGAARSPRHGENLRGPGGFVEDDGRRHGRQRPLSRRDEVGLGGCQAVVIPHTRGAKVVHLVVEHDARGRRHHRGAGPGVSTSEFSSFWLIAHSVPPITSLLPSLQPIAMSSYPLESYHMLATPQGGTLLNKTRVLQGVDDVASHGHVTGRHLKGFACDG